VLDDEAYRYVYGLGRISQVGTGSHYYLTDGLGSTMALTNDTGAVVNTYDYDVFGAERASTGSQANDFTFAGEQVDGSTGLPYLRARYLTPAEGQFLSREVYPSSVAAPWVNPYSYVEQNPTTYLDPLGLFKVKAFGATVFDSKKATKIAKTVVEHVARGGLQCVEWGTAGVLLGGNFVAGCVAGVASYAFDQFIAPKLPGPLGALGQCAIWGVSAWRGSTAVKLASKGAEAASTCLGGAVASLSRNKSKEGQCSSWGGASGAAAVFSRNSSAVWGFGIGCTAGAISSVSDSLLERVFE
jgi:RHS repeat-associated protein